MERKYICSVQTPFTRTRRCPWRCSCTEARAATETSRTSFRMNWTCSSTQGCHSECSVEAESWASVSISYFPGTIILTMTRLELNTPPCPPRRPAAAPELVPALAWHNTAAALAQREHEGEERVHCWRHFQFLHLQHFAQHVARSDTDGVFFLR